MSAGSRPLWAKFRICSYGSAEAAVEVSGELHFDSTLQQVPDRIELFGGQDESLALMRVMGGLLQIENLTVGERERRTFLGRLSSVSALHKKAKEELAKVAEIVLEKAITELDRPAEDSPHHCSYTYAADVAGWPVSGMFGTSYDGTIEAHQFEEGLYLLLKTEDLSLTATPHYFFRDQGRQLIRQSLASISLEWTRKALDEKRLMDCARLVLSFLYAVKLRPLIKTLSVAGRYRRVSWSASELETVDRDRFSGPISISDQQDFQAEAIEALYSSGYEVDQLQAIVDRYVEARTDVALARSFAHGCEAIEGLYALLKATMPSSPAPDYTDVKTRLKTVLEAEVKDPDDLAVASSRIDQLFARPTWRRVKVLLESLATGQNDLIHKVLQRANFFRYRNLSSHGQVVRLDNEVVHQANMMQFVLEWMFIKVCKGGAAPQMAAQLHQELEQNETPNRGIIQVWE